MAEDVTVGRFAGHGSLDRACFVDQPRTDRGDRLAVSGVEVDDRRPSLGQRRSADLYGQSCRTAGDTEVLGRVDGAGLYCTGPQDAGPEEGALLHEHGALGTVVVTPNVHAGDLAGDVLGAGGEVGFQPDGVDDASLGVTGRYPALIGRRRLEADGPTALAAKPALGETLVVRVKCAVDACDVPDDRQHLAVDQVVDIGDGKAGGHPVEVAAMADVEAQAGPVLDRGFDLMGLSGIVVDFVKLRVGIGRFEQDIPKEVHALPVRVGGRSPRIVTGDAEGVVVPGCCPAGIGLLFVVEDLVDLNGDVRSVLCGDS